MSYLVAMGLSEEERETELLKIRRREFALARQRMELGRRANFWTAVQAVATVGIPLATFLGIQRYFRESS